MRHSPPNPESPEYQTEISKVSLDKTPLDKALLNPKP